MLDHDVTFRVFNMADLSVYRRWFSDAELSSRLDYPNDNWFRYINSQESDCWVALIEERIVGVMQIDAEVEGRAPMDIAICPTLRNNGFGKKVLQAFLAKVGSQYSTISASIEADNLASLACFSACGFSRDAAQDQDGFIEFSYVVQRR